ncbi:hypothetical protein BDP27DRAFT_1421815 [Rhodocollybia butyracea]|uniref:Uncharacterized protein n=1 Tax=Rhodocollybia butyracea TaxID=206335 RepID=A0A9P5PSB8_9AGAR|nr:hypothetical protein BDP27DRAFT_1421815 [Rhodocollybia butyracea]
MIGGLENVNLLELPETVRPEKFLKYIMALSKGVGPPGTLLAQAINFFSIKSRTQLDAVGLNAIAFTWFNKLSVTEYDPGNTFDNDRTAVVSRHSDRVYIEHPPFPGHLVFPRHLTSTFRIHSNSNRIGHMSHDIRSRAGLFMKPSTAGI